jgi:UDP-2,4-diacetamido-2,4,6-trideoxy-beta-L-altropyranose hydrolase
VILKTPDLNIVFRVDASSVMGTGHLMRCLTLAAKLRESGAYTHFVCRQIPEQLHGLLLEKGHEVSLLSKLDNNQSDSNLLHADWLDVSQQFDAKETIEAISGQNWDWLVVDHYGLDYRWETGLRQAVDKILVIDDLADRKHDCDALLDQNLYSDMDSRYTSKVPEFCKLLLGPGYALLRNEFIYARKEVSLSTIDVKRILVFFGGVDLDNYTSMAIAALASLNMQDVRVDVVIGSSHPQKCNILEQCQNNSFNCHVQTNKMAELMSAADLAIGAGGSATWERCCLGLPTIAWSIARNQQKLVEDAALSGLIYSLDTRKLTVDFLTRHLQALIENHQLRQMLSKRGMSEVDGRGALRVSRVLEIPSFNVREVNANDSKFLYEWRNDPVIRRVSREDGIIPLEDHQKWFSSVISDPKRILLLIERGGSAIGVVRFDFESECAEVSIYLVPGNVGGGLGGGVLRKSEQWLKAKRPNVTIINAEVLGDNRRSHNLFKRGGYELASSHYSKRL